MCDTFCLNQTSINGQNKIVQARDGLNPEIYLDQFRPYAESASILNQLFKITAPVNKIQVILKCSQNITQAIEKFYCDNQLPKEKWLLDADQVLSIFCFIIAQAKVPNLHAHLFMLQQFSTSHQTMSMSGYYISVVLSCALQQLQRNPKGRQAKGISLFYCDIVYQFA